MDDQLVWIGIILFWATFTQGAAGFGMALVSMPLLVSLVGLSVAAPLVATLGLFSPGLIAWHYRREIERTELTFPAVGSLIGIPLGVVMISAANEQIVKGLLGVVIVGYVVYSTLKPSLSFSNRTTWGTSLGFAGGILTGAYNTGGPALVIYGTGRKWSPLSFKANMQVLLLLHSVGVMLSHALNHHFTHDVLSALPVGMVFSILGTSAGIMMDRFMNPIMFRRLIFAVLLVSGSYLLYTVGYDLLS